MSHTGPLAYLGGKSILFAAAPHHLGTEAWRLAARSCGQYQLIQRLREERVRVGTLILRYRKHPSQRPKRLYTMLIL